MMKIKKAEMKKLIEVLLELTSNDNNHVEPVYKVEDKFYRLKSISQSHRDKSLRVELIETNKYGVNNYEEGVVALLDFEEFKSSAIIYSIIGKE